MSEPQDWLRLVAAAHAAGENVWTAGSVAVYRVLGGDNNALYRIETDGQQYAVKLCVDDERRRATREYGVMRMLQTARLDLAPEPLWLEERCTIIPFPAVVYRWLPGEPIRHPLTTPQLTALLDALHGLHSLQRGQLAEDNLPEAWFHWFDFAPYLEELQSLLAKYGLWLARTDTDGPDLHDRLARLVATCSGILKKAPTTPRRGQFPLRLCRVDQNLENAILGEDGRLRWVDWEYSGWGDPAMDLAELRWHAALAELSEAQQAWLRDNYRRPAGDPHFEERLALWDRLISTRWPFLILRWLWSQEHGPDRVRLSQMSLDPVEMRDRLVRFIERAERWGDSAGR